MRKKGKNSTDLLIFSSASTNYQQNSFKSPIFTGFSQLFFLNFPSTFPLLSFY